MSGSAATGAREIEFWFDFGSNYSYLSAMRIEDETQRHGVSIAWKPCLLGPIFRELGMSNSPFVLQKEKGAYMWQDMVRRCRKYGLSWTRPTDFPRNGVLPARIALLGVDEPWIGAFCRRVMVLNFVRDEDINGSSQMSSLLLELGLPAAELVERATSEPIKALLRKQTETARAKGIFGAPTFFVGAEMFWGDDRMDDAIAYARDGA